MQQSQPTVSSELTPTSKLHKWKMMQPDLQFIETAHQDQAEDVKDGIGDTIEVAAHGEQRAIAVIKAANVEDEAAQPSV
eukprot:8130897-Alexandrium_andersonii.AAC.1